MTDMVKNMRQWAKQREWVVQLVDDITRIEGLLAAENEAQARYDAIRVKSDDLIVEQKLAEESIAAAVATAQQTVESADKYAAAARLDADSVASEARLIAAEIVNSAKSNADTLARDAQQSVLASQVQVKSNNDAIAVQGRAIAKAQADYDDVIESIENAKAKAKALFAGIGS